MSLFFSGGDVILASDHGALNVQLINGLMIVGLLIGFAVLVHMFRNCSWGTEVTEISDDTGEE